MSLELFLRCNMPTGVLDTLTAGLMKGKFSKRALDIFFLLLSGSI